MIKMQVQNDSVTVIEQMSWFISRLVNTKNFDLKAGSLLLNGIIRGGFMEEVGLEGALKDKIGINREGRMNEGFLKSSVPLLKWMIQK